MMWRMGADELERKVTKMADQDENRKISVGGFDISINGLTVIIGIVVGILVLLGIATAASVYIMKWIAESPEYVDELGGQVDDMFDHG